MHGKESVQDVRSVQPTAAIKKLAATAELRAEAEMWARAIVPNLSGLLIDSAAGGGSGTESDWSLLETFFASVDRSALPPLVIAGGLRPGTIARIIKRFSPWAVDVSSGVEEEPGRKSLTLMKEFVKAVRQAEKR
jgi:phosphoribosylanthranilate isomerase